MPTARTSRLTITDADAARLSARLTPRDRMLLHLLADHRVLTTEQVRTVAFEAITTCRHRLAELRKLGLVDRLLPLLRSDGAHDEGHWFLDRLGAYAVYVVDRRADPKAVPWRREAATITLMSAERAHLKGVNGLMAALAGHAYRTEGCELALWWSERRFAAWWDETTGRSRPQTGWGFSPWAAVRPDAYAVWVEDGVALPFALEYDRGTETLDRLRGKLPGYVDLAVMFRRPVWALFAFTSDRREHNARKMLDVATVPIATATFPEDRPAEPWRPAWSPLGSDRCLTLTDLAGEPWPAATSSLLAFLADEEALKADRRTADSPMRFGSPPPDPLGPDKEPVGDLP